LEDTKNIKIMKPNLKQQEAIEYTDGALLIIAGA